MMTDPLTDTLADPCAHLMDAEEQRQAATMAQDAFTRIFRLTIEGEISELDTAVGELARRSQAWSQAGGTAPRRALRLALLVSGMDQWGLAYTQAFGLTAIPGLSALLGMLRTGLDAQSDAQFAQQYAALDANEMSAIDFTMSVRRHIHIALWHALIACDDDDIESAERIASTLGSLLLAQDARRPHVGWRLVADTLAHIQVGLLQVSAGETAISRTQTLFSSLRQALAPERAQAIFALANQAAVQWQAARKAVH
jgi:hypothetical protein